MYRANDLAGCSIVEIHLKVLMYRVTCDFESALVYNSISSLLKLYHLTGDYNIRHIFDRIAEGIVQFENTNLIDVHLSNKNTTLTPPLRKNVRER